MVNDHCVPQTEDADDDNGVGDDDDQSLVKGNTWSANTNKSRMKLVRRIGSIIVI